MNNEGGIPAGRKDQSKNKETGTCRDGHVINVPDCLEVRLVIDLMFILRWVLRL